jgi:hypothetical protein
MELRDLIVTPFIIILVYIVAYIIRPHVTDSITRQYFFPALSVKIVGAIALGFIYQFYYHGGDTYNYHTHGSRHVWEAFMDAPEKGLKLLINNGDEVGVYRYSSLIPFYHDPASYVIIRIASIFDLLTFSSYSGTAVLFACIGFVGMWLFFLAFYSMSPHLHRQIAIASFFIPSVFFWGSGLLKDTVTMACLGSLTYAIKKLLIDKKLRLWLVLLLVASLYLIFEIKKYILLCYLPAVLLWVYARNLAKIRSRFLKIMLIPIFLLIIGTSGYFAITLVGTGDDKYSIDKIATTTQVTANDIRYLTGKDAGSGYSLGQLDGSFSGMLKLAPMAVNVSLFRPYLWEVSNPFMLLSALESLSFLLLLAIVIFRGRKYLLSSVLNPNVLFCLVFSITFAFGVGISTYNFGTLVRYKIPLMPFFLMALIMMLDQVNSARKLSALDDTE